jgi:hypothetical protein
LLGDDDEFALFVLVSFKDVFVLDLDGFLGADLGVADGRLIFLCSMRRSIPSRVSEAEYSLTGMLMMPKEMEPAQRARMEESPI